MAHIPLAGAHAEPRGAAGSEEVDVLRPEAGALCRDQASAVQALDWDGARGGRAAAGDHRSCWSSRVPLRPLRGLQETRVATREESGVLGFPSRRGLTPRVVQRRQSWP